VGKSNLAKGDITLLSYLPGGSMCHVVGPGGCIWDTELLADFGGGRF